ncbi:MAG: succinate dehydrogenase, hydrophobic membrane anchor protein [Gammaproteobacteria bacterium]|nr:succinate dehydrogenase, hydrophobic membrane anchor protein [Gammaproteobacteria bacterium]MDH5652593.1 succinate dehydrogenase, hydrophobic membrane anchor protein [Gammaproteobacteria bacterium]
MSWRAHGMRAWVLQRFSAAYIAVYVLVILVYLVPNLPMNFLQWREIFAAPVMNIATLLFQIALLAHAWVGIRDIIIDYVHPVPLRLVLMTGMSLLQIILTVWVSMLMFSVVRL